MDGGYLNWSSTVPPVKNAVAFVQERWSKWAESMRKDVECTFGILKGRWRILKTGIRLQSLNAADDIWFTCCALHNMLLEVDGLNTRWYEGVPSDYEGEMGLHDVRDVRAHVAPAVYGRMADVRQYNPALPYRIQQARVRRHEGQEAAANDGRPVNIKHLSLNGFRNYLVNHFQYEWEQKAVIWPRRVGGKAPRINGQR